ncbi:hypothetical protein [Breznakibacter xylanolyticus]|uniref:hypothetical protein n=1 Tax=Breznakibacter xylanolyticus TaxID=990 RepID=UPI0011B3632C|nr:hypothetical protein [Breznakibacter xylanolyticus]
MSQNKTVKLLIKNIGIKEANLPELRTGYKDDPLVWFYLEIMIKGDISDYYTTVAYKDLDYSNYLGSEDEVLKSNEVKDFTLVLDFVHDLSKAGNYKVRGVSKLKGCAGHATPWYNFKVE